MSLQAGIEQRNWRTRLAESDLWYSFRHSPLAVVSAIVAVVIMFSAFFAELVAPHDPFNLATVDLFNALLPPLPAQSSSSWQPVEGHLKTRWAADVDPRMPLPEYPRPQMTRTAWQDFQLVRRVLDEQT